MSRLVVKLVNSDTINFNGANYESTIDEWMKARGRSTVLSVKGEEGRLSIHPDHIVSIQEVK